MFVCETLVDAALISRAWLTRNQVDAEIACLLADGWQWLVRSSGWLSLYAMQGEHVAIIRFTR